MTAVNAASAKFKIDFFINSCDGLCYTPCSMLLERRVYHTNILSYYDYSVKKIIFAGPNGFNMFH